MLAVLIIVIVMRKLYCKTPNNNHGHEFEMADIAGIRNPNFGDNLRDRNSNFEDDLGDFNRRSM